MRINRRQLMTIWIVAILVVLSVIFPPWVKGWWKHDPGFDYSGAFSPVIHGSRGWFFIGRPPDISCVIDMPLLAAEWFAILVVGAAAFVTFGRTNNDETKVEEPLAAVQPATRQIELGLD